MTFGERLQALRQRQGLSQDALAERLNVSRQAVSRWERDETMPETDKVVALAELFGVTTDHLLRDRPQPEPPPADSREKRAGHDLICRLGHLAETKWYLLGWLLVAWGAVDLLGTAAVRLAWGRLGGLVGATATGDVPPWMGDLPADMPQMLSPFLDLLWLNVLYAAVKIAAGLLVVFLGRRYVRRRGEKR